VIDLEIMQINGYLTANTVSICTTWSTGPTQASVHLWQHDSATVWQHDSATVLWV